MSEKIAKTNLIELEPVTHGFTKVPNTLIQYNKDITAMGLFCYCKIKNLPADWSFSEAGFAATIAQYSKNTVIKGLRNLEENGYLIRARYLKANNLLGSAYWLLLGYPEYYDAYLKVFKMCGLVVSEKYKNKVEQMPLSELNKKALIEQLVSLTKDDFTSMLEEEMAKKK